MQQLIFNNFNIIRKTDEMRKSYLTILLSFIILLSYAQQKAEKSDNERWQQKAKYTMEIDMDVKPIDLKEFRD